MTFRQVLSIICASIATVNSLFFCNGVTRMKPVNEEEILLNITAISDVHMDEGLLRRGMLANGLKDISRSTADVDALIVAGDITDHGEPEHYDTLFRILSKYNTAKNTVLATGNHDTWSENGYEASVGGFIDGYNAYIGRNIDKPYYLTVINDYTLIVLGSEDDIGCPAYISDKQLDWLDESLEEATKDGKPAFVICHQPINDTHGMPGIWDDGNMGEQSDEVQAIFAKYDNIFFISGHTHTGFCDNLVTDTFTVSTIEEIGNVHSINLPCYMYFNSNGNPLAGYGAQIEVYEDSVIIRARNYGFSTWDKDFVYNFDIV